MTLPSLRTSTFSLPALAAEVARFAARFQAVAADERVSGTADERTLRYYQSLGVLDRPLRYEGRVAIYGYRHLLQALAVKALQARGYSLAQVQRALAGATDELLESAVLEALGEPVEGPPAAEPPLLVEERPAPAYAARPLRAYALAPGVVLTVDPAVHPDPDAVAAAVAAALPPSSPTPRGHRP